MTPIDRLAAGWTRIGWRIRRLPLTHNPLVGVVYDYATSSQSWTSERRRAVLFSDHGRRTGLDDGLKWAREHLRALRRVGLAMSPRRHRVVAVWVRRKNRRAA
jgi:hypothetical protein